jgi:hypothetical protein
MILTGETEVLGSVRSIGGMILTGETEVLGSVRSIGGMILTGKTEVMRSVWSIGGMIQTGENLSTQRQTCLSTTFSNTCMGSNMALAW